jgi:hypothetical protein
MARAWHSLIGFGDALGLVAVATDDAAADLELLFGRGLFAAATDDAAAYLELLFGRGVERLLRMTGPIAVVGLRRESPDFARSRANRDRERSRMRRGPIDARLVSLSRGSS